MKEPLWIKRIRTSIRYVKDLKELNTVYNKYKKLVDECKDKRSNLSLTAQLSFMPEVVFTDYRHNYQIVFRIKDKYEKAIT